MTPLHHAILTNELSIIQDILHEYNHDKKVVNMAQVDGFTPVHYACFLGEIRILELLIKAGGNMHQLSNNGINCLHLACQRNRLEMVRLLVNRYNFNPE